MNFLRWFFERRHKVSKVEFAAWTVGAMLAGAFAWTVFVAWMNPPIGQGPTIDRGPQHLSRVADETTSPVPVPKKKP